MKILAVLSLAAAVTAILPESDSGSDALIRRSNGRTHIGYRVVKLSEIDQLRGNGNIGAVPPEAGARQTGKGLYISPGFHQWPPEEEAKRSDLSRCWDCQVTAEPGFWEGLKKAWVPRYYVPPSDSGLDLVIHSNEKKCEKPDKPARPTLWGMLPHVDKTNRPRYLSYLDNSFTTSNTVLFSHIQKHTDLTQGLIPIGILDQQRIYLENCIQRTAPDNAAVNIGDVPWAFVPLLPGKGLGTDLAYDEVSIS